MDNFQTIFGQYIGNIYIMTINVLFFLDNNWTIFRQAGAELCQVLVWHKKFKNPFSVNIWKFNCLVQAGKI